MKHLKKILFIFLLFLFSSKAKSQTLFYYLGESNKQDTVSIKSYFAELGGRLKSEAYVLVNFSKTPVLCEGLAIDACIANQANRATDIESIDSLALSLMVQTVNQIQNPINNIDFYFFISSKTIQDNSLNQFISKLLLATNLFANPNTSIYLLVKDKKLIPQLAFLKSNKNYAQFQIKQY
jgi:hypothetical protein